MSYTPLPTFEPATSYPPDAWKEGDDPVLRPSFHRNDKRWRWIRYVFLSALLLALGHFSLLGAFPTSRYARHFRTASLEEDAAYSAIEQSAQEMLDQLDPSAGQPGTFFRDAFPIKSMLAFWELAEKEVEARKLDTCRGQLSRELIDAYHRSQMAYCLPEGADTAVYLSNATDSPALGATKIWCAPVHRDSFSNWWPYPAAPCFSINIRSIKDSDRKFSAAGCQVTSDGSALLAEMKRERFLGTDLQKVDLEVPACKEVSARTHIVIGRQDQWNPFHVSEDLITTLVTVFIVARAVPEIVETRVQLVFSEGFGMDTNHFTPLWDRIGAWAPRRLSLDPWDEDVCLTNTIHSVGAGASLLSAPSIARGYSCASTITWAAAHYYRHLFGLLPNSLSDRSVLDPTLPTPRRPINILWLSRAKLDAYAQGHDDWSTWRDVRHITNEKELVRSLKGGLRDLCGVANSGCVFEDAIEFPEHWGLTSPETIESDQPIPIRFATLDPTVHALETQVHYVGHTTILMSSHGGALGLSLFLPPGAGTIIELQVETVQGNYHFQHMASEMGHDYEQLQITKEVNIEQVWQSMHRWVLRKAHMS